MEAEKEPHPLKPFAAAAQLVHSTEVDTACRPCLQRAQHFGVDTLLGGNTHRFSPLGLKACLEGDSQ